MRAGAAAGRAGCPASTGAEPALGAAGFLDAGNAPNPGATMLSTMTAILPNRVLFRGSVGVPHAHTDSRESAAVLRHSFGQPEVRRLDKPGRLTG